VEFLRCETVIAPEKTSRRRGTPLEQFVQAYERYLRKERLLAKGSARKLATGAAIRGRWRVIEAQRIRLAPAAFGVNYIAANVASDFSLDICCLTLYDIGQSF
jgi:hypothetical protein